MRIAAPSGEQHKAPAARLFPFAGALLSISGGDVRLKVIAIYRKSET
jgi:hypothetical protein